MKRTFNKIFRNRLTIAFMPFYRQYPYAGGVAIDSADSRGCIDMELGFFCNRIPKAANSTVVINLARMRFGKEIPSKQAKKLFRTPSELSVREVSKIPSLFKFTVVRNPFSRTLSAYLDKVERRALKANRSTSFREFLLSLKNGRLNSNGHWAPQTALLLLPVDQFDFIGKVESLETDLARIEEKIQGHPPKIPFTSVLSNATGANEKIAAYYDDETTELVRLLYRNDFKTFQYADTLLL